MYTICGKSAAGKNAVADELIKRGHERCITYTTRKQRPKEENGVDYHFVSDREFQLLLEENFFAECISYDTVHGKWWYGTAAKDFEDDNDKKFIILTPEGINQVEKVTGIRPKIIYIFANRKTILERLEHRGDNPDEVKRRMEQDEIDFKGFENIADRIFYNNSGTDVKEVADKIEKYLGIEGSGSNGLN